MGSSSVADYCRAIEAHLTRVNGGHLVRIVGPGFTLVRDWEAAGIPLSVVQRGIDQKAERHNAGAAARRGRPLHIQFCADDVLQLFDDWKRAVGVAALPEETASAEAADVALTPEAAKKPSLSKHLERVSERLSRLLGRSDLPETFLERVNLTISAVASARDRARTARGPARDEIAASLKPLGNELMQAAREVLSASEREQLQRQAESELAPYRGRLDPDAWDAAIGATIDRLLRERFTLPIIDPDAA